MARRIAAWLVTGPVGHGVAGAADWAELLARAAWAECQRRIRPRAKAPRGGR